MSPTEEKKGLCQLIRAPDRPTVQHAKTLFLSGTVSPPGADDWRQTVVFAVTTAGLPVTVFDPVRPDWDATWREEVSFEPFRTQVQWELDRQEEASLVAIYFGPPNIGAISLLELGLCAQTRSWRGRAGMPNDEVVGALSTSTTSTTSTTSKELVVACAPDYAKRGNVEMVCRRYGIVMVDSATELAQAVIERLQ